MISSSKTKASAKADEGRLADTPACRPAPLQRAASYYRLTKPGIVYGNCLTTAAGFLYASNVTVMSTASWLRLAATLVGTGLVIAAACVLNNYLDRSIDQKMERTRHRPLAAGLISGRSALVYAAGLALAGIGLLTLATNLLTVYLGLAGLYGYVAAYGYAKRRTPWGTLIGSVPGAIPLVAGYTAITGHLDLTAGLLFLAMAAWQMPHFYALAIYRLDDYRTAGLPVWPASRGVADTTRQMVGFTAVYAASIILLGAYGHAGAVFTGIMTVLSLAWLWRTAAGLRLGGGAPTDRWARQAFGMSLQVLLVFSVLLACHSLVP